MLRISPQLQVRYANAAARQLLGPVQGRPRQLEDFGPLGAHLARLCRRAMDERRTIVERELEGSSGPLDVNLSPEPQADALGVLMEVLPMGWHADAWAERQAASLDAALRQMLRGLGHELKNPLGGLRGAAQLLERRVSDPELEEFCRVIVSEADRLAGLVDRLAADPQGVPDEPINVHAAMERVFQLAAAAGGAGLRRDYDPSIPEIRANLDGLIQALLNLVNNAVESGADRVTLRTRVRRRRSERGLEIAPQVALEVEDDGPGVPEALGRSILYPMVTGRPGGTGFGLTVVQAIVARHRGRLEFDSRPGRTVFTILLPLERRDG